MVFVFTLIDSVVVVGGASIGIRDDVDSIVELLLLVILTLELSASVAIVVVVVVVVVVVIDDDDNDRFFAGFSIDVADSIVIFDDNDAT